MDFKNLKFVFCWLAAMLMITSVFSISSAAKAPGFNECPKVVVCGADGKTYESPCEARNAGVTSYKAGTPCNEKKAAQRKEKEKSSSATPKKKESVKEDVRCSFVNPPLKDSAGSMIANKCSATIDKRRFSCQLNASVSEKNKDLFCDIKGVKGFFQDVSWESSYCGTAKHTLDGKPKKEADKIVFTCLPTVTPSIPAPAVRKFSRVSWECHDGFFVKAISPTPLAESSWRNDGGNGIADTLCKGRCDAEALKCGINTFKLEV